MSAPTGMIHIDEFAKQKKMSAEKVKKMISEGFYRAEWVGDDLYVTDSKGLSQNTRASIDLNNGVTSVVVTDIDMRFGSMVKFMVKWVIAAIPASIILAFFVFAIYAFFISLFF